MAAPLSHRSLLIALLALLSLSLAGCAADRSLTREPEIDTTPLPGESSMPLDGVQTRELPPSRVPVVVYTSESDIPQARSAAAPVAAPVEEDPLGDGPSEPVQEAKPAPAPKAKAAAPAASSAAGHGAGWVASLKIAQSATQIVIVAVETGTSNATVSMYDRLDDGSWVEILSVPGFIGRGGLGKTADGDKKTPQGLYHFTRAFGTADGPLMRRSSYTYHKLTASDYWVGDSSSKLYNKMADASTQKGFDTSKGARLIRQPANKYALAISYNAKGEPGKGSGIFLHCGNAPTMGSVAISEDAMLEVLGHVTTTTVIIIDRKTRVSSY